MNTSAIRDRLRQTRFLEGTTDSAIHQLARVVTATTFESDQLLFEEGSPRHAMPIINTGAIAIEKSNAGRPVRLITLGPGEAVGEGLLLDELPHGTSARAIQKTEAYVLTLDSVRDMMK